MPSLDSCSHPTREKCVEKKYKLTAAPLVFGGGLWRSTPSTGAMSWFPRRRHPPLCSYYSLHQEPALWYAPRSSYLPLVLLQFPLPEIYASCNWCVWRLWVEAMARPLGSEAEQTQHFGFFQRRHWRLLEVGRLSRLARMWSQVDSGFSFRAEGLNLHNQPQATVIILSNFELLAFWLFVALLKNRREAREWCLQQRAHCTQLN